MEEWCILVLAASFDKSNHRKQSATKFWPIGGLLSSTDSTPLSILIAYLKISNLSLLAVAQLIIPASPSLFLLQNDVSKKRKNDYKKPLRMVRGCSIEQPLYNNNYTGKNFVPVIKTRSPVMKAVKLMAWRQAKSTLKITTWSGGQRLSSQIY